MNFLELTSYIGDPQGYSDFPFFQSDIWPFLRRKGKEIDVFLFRNSSNSLGWLGHYDVVTANIVRIGSMNELTDRELSMIQHWSFYGGHLNVIYRAATESSLVSELCSMYPSIDLSSDGIDQLGLEQESLSELRWLTAASPKEVLHFSFAHDGDPLYIFGDLEALRALLRRHYASR